MTLALLEKQDVVSQTTVEQKLLDLADFMEAVPSKQFYMGSWFRDRTAGHSDFNFDPVRLEHFALGECGSSCCLAGWEVVRCGMTIAPAKNQDFLCDSYAEPTVPEFGYDTVCHAASRLLGLADGEAAHLFCASEWISNDSGGRFHETPSGVASMLRRYARLRAKYGVDKLLRMLEAGYAVRELRVVKRRIELGFNFVNKYATVLP